MKLNTTASIAGTTSASVSLGHATDRHLASRAINTTGRHRDSSHATSGRRLGIVSGCALVSCRLILYPAHFPFIHVDLS